MKGMGLVGLQKKLSMPFICSDYVPVCQTFILTIAIRRRGFYLKQSKIRSSVHFTQQIVLNPIYGELAYGVGQGAVSIALGFPWSLGDYVA